MSKELEEYKYSNLELLREIWFNVPEGSQKIHQKHFDLILSKLNELQAIKEAKPSEALKSLERIKNIQVCIDYEKDIIKSVNEILPNSCDKVEQSLIKSQEQEKVLKILKEKSLSLLVFKTFKMYDKDGVLELDYQYFVDCHKAIAEELDEEAQEQVATEEEFELLKRYFK